ncbi:ParB/RepB/Spo0J family partition protein [Pseudaestuariivita rosea]|uniref:ParB/RepB/Spo0J family partition protein n=1 Tax=Pseudaestuariivita rosea TaxID=2763263 RepID=UPI001ABBAB4B|nr:ParB/RepB/Spo0J family partition protein [Pseudaestuariivita rosea]
MSSNKGKNRGLGRGLSALMSDIVPDDAAETGKSKVADTVIPIENIAANPDQPRRTFDQSDLDDLAASIKHRGIIQPIIVRSAPAGAGAKYQIIAGERRWRAAQIAQLHEVPVIIREFSDVEVLEIAIIENIQRADLNPLEEAQGYRQLMDRFGHTQEQLADAMGKSRSYIANLLRLMSLPEDVQLLVREGKLSAGHARALITSDNPSVLAKQVVANQLSVRETEKLAKSESKSTKQKIVPPAKDADTRALEGDLSANLGMRVSISHNDGQENGHLTIKYKSLEQLDDLCRKLAVIE